MERPEPASIPQTPGVYMYKDARGKIIYIGKARILRRRVLSYFRPTGLPAKTVAMISRAASIDYLATTSEKEALLLEASLIKKHRPHYNIVLRDDKQYALFRLDMKQKFPRLEITRKARKDGAKYFGPFTSAVSARETWKLLHRVFPLRRCPDRTMKNRVRPCLYYHMGQCPAPCMGKITPEEYGKGVKKVSELLAGNSRQLLGQLSEEMNNAAEKMEYEKAARLRDQIRAVEKTIERQAAVLPGAGDMDAIGLHQSEKGLGLGIIFVRKGKVGEGRAFFWPGLTYEDAPELMASFLGQFYTTNAPPPKILLPWLPEELEGTDGEEGQEEKAELEMERKAQEQAFAERRGAPVRIASPKNQAEHQLVNLARANAREESRRRQGHDIGDLLSRLGKALNLEEAPARIECIDVSHISGTQTRVGMVVYEDGKPSRDLWRVYAMPDSADDFTTLHGWIARRLESGPPWPDLLLVDGGRGQLASVMKALKEAGEADLFGVAAIAKARGEHGRPDRRAGNIADRIFIHGRLNPLPLKEGSQELLFLQQIRDATHQFAVQGHRRARKAVAFSGELMRLPGIGPATARLLWDKYGSIEAMSKATAEDLRQLPGIGLQKSIALAEKLKTLA